jgi:nucleoside-diphosphate-sugar epimerase
VTDSASVFVTGGSGFVGRHIVRLLIARGFKVRLLARRLPERAPDKSLEIVTGDLTQPETYAASLRGVTAVIHAALTDSFANDVPATLALQKLSAQADVRKFIHLSSIAVNGIRTEGTITEETPPVPGSDNYSRAKAAIERGLRENSGVPELLILRLGCVYGPDGGWWSNSLLDMMERGKLILVDGGAGTANLIHVADVAAVVLTLLERSNSPLDIFHATDGMPVPWSSYFSELEGILGRTATVSMTVEEARRHGRKWLRPSFPRRAIRKLMRGEVIYPLGDVDIQGFASRAIYSNKKASTVLGFKPMYDLKSGMETVRLDRQSRLKPALGAK